MIFPSEDVTWQTFDVWPISVTMGLMFDEKLVEISLRSHAQTVLSKEDDKRQPCGNQEHGGIYERCEMISEWALNDARRVYFLESSTSANEWM